MKKTLLILLILSSNLIYSANISVKATNNEKLKPLRKYKTSSQYLDDEIKNTNCNIKIIRKEINFLRNSMNQNNEPNRWKIIKGFIGLYIGAKFFLGGSKIIIISLFNHDTIISHLISPLETLSPLENFLTNRYLWLSASSALTIFSAWIIKRSIDNLYYGFNGTEENREWFDQNYSDY